MKFTKNVPTEFNVKFLGFSVPADSNDFCSKDPDAVNRFNQYNKKNGVLECLIHIDSGTVLEFTVNAEIDIFDKCVDEGTYILYDEDMNIVAKYEGYVPDVLEVNENGYGDYLNFTINSDGTIKNWKTHIGNLGESIFNEWYDENND